MSVSVEPIRFVFRKRDDDVYQVTLEGTAVGERTAVFAPPYDAETWAAVRMALSPGFVMTAAADEVQAAIRPLMPVAETVGTALANALLAEAGVAEGFGVALNLARGERRPLPVEMVFDADGAALAALPWELLRWENRFLVGDSSIALMRYPLASLPRIKAVEALPLRVLLVLAEPVDAPPVFPEGARREILHGLGRLDEQGAVVVDVLRPPTYRTLVEAVRNGEYHMLVFYGHGGHGREEGHGLEIGPSRMNGGVLLFEDDFGGQKLVTGAALGAALNNSSVRLVLLGACESAVVEEDFQRKGAKGQRGREEEKGRGDRLDLESSPSGLRGGRSNLGALWEGTAQGLLRAGVPLAIGMQLTMLVDAAQAFLRQFMLSLAAGKPVVEAVADGRIGLNAPGFGTAWCIPALYGRPDGETRLFDPSLPLPAETAALRARMQAQRREIAALEQAVGSLGSAQYQAEMVGLRQARQALVETRAALAQKVLGGYAAVASVLYGVPSNRVFVGRQDEVVAVSRGLAGEAPVVIWGTGGIGKTALAIEVAHRQSWRFAGGVLWLDCSGGPALDTLLDGMGAFCGAAMGQVPPEQKAQIVRGALAGMAGRCLLIWDNAEDVWGDGAVRRFVRQLPPTCQVLLTTRDEPEETGWVVQEVRPLRDERMAELFVALGSRAQVRVRSTDWGIVEQMLAWLEGHPLALELVVPLVRKRGVQRVWHDLQRRPLRGVAAAFAASYARLSAEMQQLFARLSVFRIAWAWEAAAAMLPDADAEDVADWLDGLVQRKLVNFDGVQWYGFHGLVRQYGYARLEEVGDVRPVHRLAAAYLNGKITDQKRGGTPDEVLEEMDQWELAAEWERFARRASGLVGSLDRQGYWGEIEERLVRAKTAVTTHLSGETGLEARLLNDMAILASKSARWNEAIELWQEAQELYKTAGDERGIAQTYNNLGLVYADKGEWDRAIQMYEQSLETLERVGDIHGIAQTYNNLGLVYADKGEWDRAIQMYEQSLETKERVGDIHG
ncbi:MAG: tetratricopeptide repeat protein, partial [Anaerolineales bacterium]|nr:tetratricopeptide repeat protein [Anaerolineales bacterium]